MVLNNSTKLMLGDREVIARYQGNKQVWTAETPIIYGFHVDPSISDPAQAVTYLADAVGKTPAGMTAYRQTVKGYRDLEYIQSDKYCRIDTDIVLKYTDRVETEVQLGSYAGTTAQGGGPSTFFGCYAVDSSPYLDEYGGSFCISIEGNGTATWANPYVGFDWKSSDDSVRTINNFSPATKSKIVVSKSTCSYGNVSVNIGSIAQDQPSPKWALSIFGALDLGTKVTEMTFGRYNGAKVYNFNIYDTNNIRIHNLIPVERISDGELGLVDTITGNFYTNAGTGTFVKGPYITTTEYFDYGDWANAFFMPKPCMLRSDGTVAYYLDPNDYTKKSSDTDYENMLENVTLETGGIIPATGENYATGLNEWQNRTPGYISVEPNYLYQVDKRVRVYYYSASKSFISSELTDSFNTPNNCYYIRLAADKVDNEGKPHFDNNTQMICLSSDISNSNFDGNAMMEWPLIWYKFEAGSQDGEGYFYCSDQQVDESYKCWCNYDANNNIIPHFYTAIYNGTGISKMRSLSGYTLTNDNGMGSVSLTDELTRARANNTTAADEWYIDVWSDRQLISALLVLMGKSLDVQSVFGKGQINGGETAQQNVTTGALDDKGLFYGSTTDGTIPIKVFGMENWWGTTARMTAGLIGASDGYLYKLTYGTADGSIATGYNNTGTGYKKKQMTRPSVSQGVITKMLFGEFGYLPMAAEGTDNVYYTDRYISGDYYLIASDCHYSTAVGTFGMRFDVPPNQGFWLYGAALSCKPVKKEET